MTNSIKYIFCCLLCLAGIAAQAQEKPSDKLFLKDGSALLGKVVKEENGKVNFQFTNGEQVVFRLEEIDSRVVLDEDFEYVKGGKWLNHKGIYTIFSANLLIGNPYNEFYEGNSTALEPIEVTVGYAFNKYTQIGLGTSLSALMDEGRVFVPVFLEYRITPWEFSTAPFLSVAGGYGFAATTLDETPWGVSNYDGGLHLRTTLGVTFASQNKTKFQLGIHYQLQESTEDYSNCGFVDCNQNKRFLTYKRFGLNVGLRF